MGARLESKQASGGVIRQGIWVSGRRWTRSEESGAKGDLWAALATPVSLRRAVARSFAATMKPSAGVGEVWLTDVVNDLHVVVALEDPDIEPEVRGRFIDLICDRLDPSEGELFVFPEGDLPAWAMRGEKLV